MKQCEACGESRRVLRSDPLDSFTMTIYQNELAAEMKRLTIMDQKEARNKGLKYEINFR